MPGNANLTLSDLTLSGGREGENETSAVGGGVRSEGAGTLELERVVVSNNRASGKASFGEGAGVYKKSGLLTIKDSSILGNTATASGAGAGLYAVQGTTLNLTNVVVAGNRSDTIGGGMELEGPSTIAFSTVVDNSAEGIEGGGIIVSSESVHLRSSIVTNNTSPKGADCSAGSPVSDGGNVAGASCASRSPPTSQRPTRCSVRSKARRSRSSNLSSAARRSTMQSRRALQRTFAVSRGHRAQPATRAPSSVSLPPRPWAAATAVRGRPQRRKRHR